MDDDKDKPTRRPRTAVIHGNSDLRTHMQQSIFAISRNTRDGKQNECCLRLVWQFLVRSRNAGCYVALRGNNPYFRKSRNISQS